MTVAQPGPGEAAPHFVEQLKNLCIKKVAAGFGHQTLGLVPRPYHTSVIDLLPLDLPLELAGSEIEDERYWAWRSQARWPNCDTAQHGRSFKQLYFERNLQDTLEEYDCETGDVSSLRRLLAFSARYAQGVSLAQLPSHLELDILFDGLGNSLTFLALQYGMRNVGMDFDRSIFGMKLSDCRSLARCLEYCETLTYLDLSNNTIDDDKARMLASGMINNLSVMHLDLSHNRITDRGVRAIAKLLHTRSVIAILNLASNQIHAEGGRALARALRSNHTVVSLNLRLNRLGEEGGRAIFDVLRQHPALDKLNMSANELGPVTAKAIAKFLSVNTLIRELDLTCNELTENGGAYIRETILGCEPLETCDLRLSGMCHNDTIAVQDALHAKAEAKARKMILKPRK